MSRGRNEGTGTRDRPAACEAQEGGIENQPRNPAHFDGIDAVSQRGSTLILPAPASRKPGAIKELFAKLQKALTQPHDDEPEPPRKKEKGDSEKGRGGFLKAARKIMRRVRQRQPQARAAAFLSDTLDWLNLWHDNSATAHTTAHSGDFHSAPTNHLSPRL